MKLKRTIFRGALVAACAAVMSSCVISRPTVSSQAEVKYREFSGVVTHIPVTADLDVEGVKILGSFTGVAVYNKVTQQYEYNSDTYKSLAVQNALEKAGADILLEPLFSFEIVDKKVNVKVTGYPATYINFRSATMKDKQLLEINPEKAQKMEGAVVKH